MTEQPPGPGSPADEQRTTALPRPPAPAGGSATGEPGRATGPAQSEVPPAGPSRRPPARPPDPTPYQDTTVLRRPAGPAPTSPSNLPGAVRPGGVPPWPGPQSGRSDPRSQSDPRDRSDPGGQSDPRDRRSLPDAASWPGYRGDDPYPEDGARRGGPYRGREPYRREDAYRDDGPYRRGHDSYLDHPPHGDPPYDDPYSYGDGDPYRDGWERRPDPRARRYRGGGDRRGSYPEDDDDFPAPGQDPRRRADERDRSDARPRRTAQLPPYSEPLTGPDDGPTDDRHPPGARELGGRSPRKLTVTRVAALRSRELTHRGIVKFHGAVSADGADRSGLTHLTYAVMGNYAVDAALAVALANTLFFAAAKADSTGKVLLYLLLTVAPFAVIAPLIGPLLDRVQKGRRIALAASSFGRTLLAVIMALKFDSWVIYPCALGMLVLSKSFGVLKAALTPRVLPEAITLVKTNSRMSVFGLIAGGVSGGVAAGIAALTGSAGALGFTAACAVVGGWLCLRIPAWVESTEGEVPVERRVRKHRHRVLPRPVTATLWTNATIRVETGFLALFIAFVIKSRYQSSSVVATPGVTPTAPTDQESFMQLLLLGAIGAAAGLGGFLGNALGARLPLRAPQTVALACLGTVIGAVLLAFLVPGLITAGAVALVGSTASSLAKVCLDATIQDALPEVSRASAFGRSESVLQLSWVFGGVIGLLIGGVWALNGDTQFMVGFGVIGLILLANLAQCVALRMGRSLLPPLSLRALLHLPQRHDTTPVPRPAETVPDVAGPSPPGGPGSRSPTSRASRSTGSGDAPSPAAPRSGRPTRKAGRPR